MKILQSRNELENWEEYRQYMKESLKLMDDSGAPAFISKDKIEFTIDGKPWKGHAFLAGKKADMSVKKLKKEGIIFREGVCFRKAKDLTVTDFLPKLVKESQKTFLKLKLGYSLEAIDAADDADDQSLSPERREELLTDLGKLEKDIDKILGALK